MEAGVRTLSVTDVQKVKLTRVNSSFTTGCGLKMRANVHYACPHYPFAPTFDHVNCEVYHQAFRPGVARNDVVPTKDFQYSGTLPSETISDMKLL